MKELTERQIDIIRATIQLMADEGAHNFSIRKVASRIGVTEPAIYRHFESKDDLMINLATYISRNWHELFGELKTQHLPFVEQTRVIFREVMNYLDDNREFAKTLLSSNLFATDSGMTGVLLQLKDDGMARFSEFLEIGRAGGEVRADIDTVSVTNVFFGSIWWVVTNWISDNFEGDLAERWQKVWETLVLLLKQQ